MNRLQSGAMPAPADALRVTLYSPDTHVTCDPTTPETTGIGGGVTARLRLARALAGAGARVTAVLSCRRSGSEAGVEWVTLEEQRPIECDVLLASTTGGDLSFAPLRKLEVRARLRVLWVEGFLKPHDIEALAPDVVYVASNFLRRVVVEEWGVAVDKVFVVYNGLDQESFAQASLAGAARDPFALCFTSHPSKGLDIALDVLRRLKEREPRFHLDVYGGYRLWGGKEDLDLREPDVRDCGLVGQEELARRLFTYTFGFALQTFPEPFGIAVQELKRAGVIVLASASGAYPELFLDGYDGFLFDGDPYGEETRHQAVDRVLALMITPATHTWSGRTRSRPRGAGPPVPRRCSPTGRVCSRPARARPPLPIGPGRPCGARGAACPPCRTRTDGTARSVLGCTRRPAACCASRRKVTTTARSHSPSSRGFWARRPAAAGATGWETS